MKWTKLERLDDDCICYQEIKLGSGDDGIVRVWVYGSDEGIGLETFQAGLDLGEDPVEWRDFKDFESAKTWAEKKLSEVVIKLNKDYVRKQGAPHGARKNKRTTSRKGK